MRQIFRGLCMGPCALVLASILSWPLVQPSWAGPQVGMVTDVTGSVQIFSHPSKEKPEGPPPHARYMGVYYSVKEARIGDPLGKGNILRTRPSGKARLIYENGDQIYVAPATSFVVDWKKDVPNSSEAEPQLTLSYGKSRFVIEKGGPRTKFKIQTRTAVLGVRGTDFFVAFDSTTGETETSTLRGRVEVQPEATSANVQPKPQFVSTGQTGLVSNAETVKLHAVTHEELDSVARNSQISAEPRESVPTEVLNEIKTREKSATEVTLADIHAYDPAFAAKDSETVTGLNNAVISNLQKTASDETHPGPITDKVLEKGEAPQVKPEVEESARVLPEHRFWFGVRVAHVSSDANIGGTKQTDLSSLGSCGGAGQPPCVVGISTYGSTDQGQVALQGEYALQRGFSVLGELIPFASDAVNGAFGNFFCGTSCGGQGPYGRIETKSIRLNSYLKWSYAVFGGQRFGIDLSAGPGLNILTSAKFPFANDQSITGSFKTMSLLMNAGFGIHERIADSFRLNLDFRVTRGLTNMAGSNGIFVDGTTYRLKEQSLGLALSYGI